MAYPKALLVKCTKDSKQTNSIILIKRWTSCSTKVRNEDIQRTPMKEMHAPSEQDYMKMNLSLFGVSITGVSKNSKETETTNMTLEFCGFIYFNLFLYDMV